MILERERLRVRYLSLLERMANYYYSKGEYALCMDYARGILVRDPCREEAHRLMMRCFINLGDRAQAMRQYTLCQEILRVEFDAVPEPTTTALFNQLRLNLES
jgi:two-component SAPR family response regulator